MDRFPERLKIEETNELYSRMKNGDELARARLISGNLELVSNVAHKQADSISDYDSLFSEGVLALMEAVDSYDSCDIYPYFSTYVGLKVNNAIRVAAKKLKEKREKERNFGYYISITPIQSFEEVENRLSAKQIFECISRNLTEKERYCVEKYFGFCGEEPMTMIDISKELGLSDCRIGQIIKRAYAKMRSTAERLGIFDGKKTFDNNVIASKMRPTEERLGTFDGKKTFDDNVIASKMRPIAERLGIFDEEFDIRLDEWFSDMIKSGRYRIIE